MTNSIRTICTLLAGVVATVFSASCYAADRPSDEQLSAIGLELHWSNQATLNVRRDKVKHLTNDEENVYVQSSAGLLTVLHAENGSRRWEAQVGPIDEPSLPAVSNENTVLIVAGPVAYGFNKFDGTPLFEFRLPLYPTAPPAIDKQTFYIPLTGGALYAYSLSVLEYHYRYGELPDTVAKPHIWRFICAERIIHQPVLGELALAFVTKSGSLHSVNIAGLELGRSRFQLLLKESASAPPAIARNETSSSVLLTTEDQQVFSVDLMTGRTEWIYPMGRQMQRQPLMVGESVFVVTDPGTVTKLSRDTSSVSWGRPAERPRHVEPSFIGAALVQSQLDPTIQDGFRLLSPDAVEVQGVVPGGAAANAGIMVGDRIVSADGVPISTVDGALGVLSEMPLRIERPISVVRVSMGAGFEPVQLPAAVKITNDLATSTGVRIVEVLRDSPAAEAGFEVGDVIVSIEDNPIELPEDVSLMLTAAAPGEVRMKTIRGDSRAEVTVTLAYKTDAEGLTTAGSAITMERLQMRMAVDEWDVEGIRSMAAVGLYGIYGIDLTNRLVAFDTETAKIKGRVPVTGYSVRHANEVTDFIYLSSPSGEILCLREIGPTVTVPSLTAATRSAVVSEIAVNKGDGVQATGTYLCKLELPDGETVDISISTNGVVESVIAKEGQTVVVGDPLIRIAEDRFATFHRKPESRPVDIETAPPTP